MNRLVPWLVFFVVLAVYVPSLGAGIVWDDHVLLRHGATCRGELLTCLSSPFFPSSPFQDVPPLYYRPLVTLTYALSQHAGIQHAFNVLVHALNSALLALVALRFGASRSRAALASLAWALHPRLVEDVTWISGRTDVLAATFVLGAILAWPERFDRRRTALTMVLLFLGLLSKEVAVAGFVALAALGPLSRARVLLAPAALYGGLRLLVGGLTSFSSTLGPVARIATVGEAAARYAEMAFLRLGAPFSARGAIGVLDTAHVIVGYALLAALGYGVFRALRGTSKGASVGAVLAVGSLLPVLHIMPISLHGAITVDRALYLPVAGLAIVLASARMPSMVDRWAGVLALALIGTESAFAVRAQHAFDDEVLFGITLAERADPANAGPISYLGTVVRDAGLPELACPLFSKAQHTLDQTGRRAGPTYARASENLGACLGRIGNYDESIAVYRAIAAEHPRSGRIALGLGYAQLHRLDFSAARAAAAHAVELDPRLRSETASVQRACDWASTNKDHLTSPDLFVRATYAANVGRAPEAEEAYLRVSRDTSATNSARRSALEYVAEYARPQAAYDALRSASTLTDDALVAKVSRRLADYERVARHRDRIESLARLPL